MPEGGELTLAVSEKSVQEDADLQPGDYVEIRVSDTGTGMSAGVAARAFEPFYTTKGVGRGTGLGLSQVYAMAKQAGGTARIEPHRPQGTTVVVWLPSVEPVRALADVHQDRATQASYGPKKVLVVDDDPDVRLFIANTLEMLGFQVTAAEDAERGLALLDNADPDLLVVDFAMPGMNGAQMAEVVKTRRPDLPIIFASGYSETAAIERAVGPAAILLRKPFSVADLQGVLGTVLAPQPPSDT